MKLYDDLTEQDWIILRAIKLAGIELVATNNRDSRLYEEHRKLLLWAYNTYYPHVIDRANYYIDKEYEDMMNKRQYSTCPFCRRRP